MNLYSNKDFIINISYIMKNKIVKKQDTQLDN